MTGGPLLAGALLLAACGAGGPGDAAGPEPQVLELAAEPLLVGEARAAWDPDAASDTLALHLVRDVKARGDTIGLVDFNDRVVLFDRELTPVRSFGRSGAGPGELSRPHALAFPGDSTLVADEGNMRATVYGPSGEVVRSVPLPAARGGSLAAGDDGLLFRTVQSRTHYVERIAPDGTSEPWAKRPEPRAADPGLPPGHPGFPQEFAVLSAGDTLHVLDAGTLEFLTYAPDGRLVIRKALPPALRQAVLEGTGVVFEGTAERGSARFTPAVLDFELAPDGRLVVLFQPRTSLGPLIGLVFEPGGYAATRLELAPGVERFALSAAAPVGGGLIVATPRGTLRAYDIGW